MFLQARTANGYYFCTFLGLRFFHGKNSTEWGVEIEVHKIAFVFVRDIVKVGKLFQKLKRDTHTHRPRVDLISLFLRKKRRSK
jgi:hypothetical protein